MRSLIHVRMESVESGRLVGASLSKNHPPSVTRWLLQAEHGSLVRFAALWCIKKLRSLAQCRVCNHLSGAQNYALPCCLTKCLLGPTKCSKFSLYLNYIDHKSSRIHIKTIQNTNRSFRIDKLWKCCKDRGVKIRLKRTRNYLFLNVCARLSAAAAIRHGEALKSSLTFNNSMTKTKAASSQHSETIFRLQKIPHQQRKQSINRHFVPNLKRSDANWTHFCQILKIARLLWTHYMFSDESLERPKLLLRPPDRDALSGSARSCWGPTGWAGWAGSGTGPSWSWTWACEREGCGVRELEESCRRPSRVWTARPGAEPAEEDSVRSWSPPSRRRS